MSVPVEDLISYLQEHQSKRDFDARPVTPPPTPRVPPNTIQSQQSIIVYDPNDHYPTQQQMEVNARDWTYEHIRTLIYWMNIANINIFLLDASIQHYKKIVMQVMAFTFLFSSLSTTISLSQLGIDEEKYPGLSNGIKYTFVVASTISTILVGYVKLFKLQEMMDANIEMHKDWLDFATKISGELQMPKRLRTPALKLLQNMKGSYIGLFCKRPFVPGIIKRYANRYFMNYIENTMEIRSHACCTRHNYIKRTNIFFVFQDIMKNEIKRLAGEIEVDNTVVNENEGSFIEGPLAAGTEFGRPKLATSSELKGNIMIDYDYDGPFIVIKVINKLPPVSGVSVKSESRRRVQNEETAISMQEMYSSPVQRRGRSELKTQKRTMFGAVRQKMKNLSSAGSDTDESVEEYRPRAASFQAPERALYTQMQYRSSEAAPASPPGRGSELVNTKTSSFSLKQKKDMGSIIQQLNEEIIAKRRRSVVPGQLPSITSPSKNADVSREELMKLFPMIKENDRTSVASSGANSVNHLAKFDAQLAAMVNDDGSESSGSSAGSVSSTASQEHQEVQN